MKIRRHTFCAVVILTVFWLLIAGITGFTQAEAETGPEFVLVQAGSYQRGDEVGDLWPGCRPLHMVTLTYDFYAAKYPITFTEYDRFCLATDRQLAYDHGWGREDRPVIYVSWWDAIAYCNWLSLQEGLPPAYDSQGRLLDSGGSLTDDISAVRGYRLLTEAEWEYAASGGHKALPIPPRFLYSGSDILGEVGWYAQNSGDAWVFTGTPLTVDYARHGASLYEGKSSQPVGLLLPNALGMYDLSGNVWEWCHDYYGPYEEGTFVNPIGPDSGHVRVMRGGSWVFGANDCRVACRLYRSPHDRIYRIGFRVGRTV